MDLKSTKPLEVFINNKLSTGHLVIHPNDGFDLGLMNNSNRVAVYMNLSTAAKESESSSQSGEIYLSNSCKSGTLEVSQRQWELMDKRGQVILAMKENSVFIVSNTAT
jgi:hypothetical protein